MSNQPEQSKQNNPTSKKVQPSTLAQPSVQTESIKEISEEELEQVTGSGLNLGQRLIAGEAGSDAKYDSKTGMAVFKSPEARKRFDLRQGYDPTKE